VKAQRDGLRYNTEFYNQIDDLRCKVVEVPRQARDTEFYNQIDDLSKIRGFK